VRPDVIAPNVTTLHPTRAEPLDPPDIEFMIFKENGKVYVGMSWQDYLTLGEFMTDLKEYIQIENLVVCHYRAELEEARCIKP